VRGQRVYYQNISGAVLDSAADEVTVELHDGRVLVVREKDLVLAEDAASVARRQQTASV
jgi:hypothetical protein